MFWFIDNSLTITGGGTEGNIEENNANNGSSSMTSTNSPPHQQHEEEEYNFSQLLSSEDQTRTDRQSWLLGNIESLSHRLRSVSKAYHHQHNTLTKSHHHNTNRMDIIDESLEYSLPYHTIIIDCAPIAFVDQMGAKALYQVCVCSVCVYSVCVCVCVVCVCVCVCSVCVCVCVCA